MHTFITDIAKHTSFTNKITYFDYKTHDVKFCRDIKQYMPKAFEKYLGDMSQLNDDELSLLVDYIERTDRKQLMAFYWRFRYLPQLLNEVEDVYNEKHRTRVNLLNLLIEYINYHRDHITGHNLAVYYNSNDLLNELLQELYGKIHEQNPNLESWSNLSWSAFNSVIIQYIDALKSKASSDKTSITIKYNESDDDSDPPQKQVSNDDSSRPKKQVSNDLKHDDESDDDWGESDDVRDGDTESLRKPRKIRLDAGNDDTESLRKPRKIRLDADDTIIDVLENEALKKQYAELKTKYDSLNAQHQDLQTKHQDLQTKHQDLQTKSQAMHKVRHELHDELDDTRAELKLTHAKYDELQKKYTDVWNERDDMCDKLSNMRAELKLECIKSEELRDERDDMLDERNDTQSKYDKLQNKFTELSDKYHAMVKKITEVHSLVE